MVLCGVVWCLVEVIDVLEELAGSESRRPAAGQSSRELIELVRLLVEGRSRKRSVMYKSGDTRQTMVKSRV